MTRLGNIHYLRGIKPESVIRLAECVLGSEKDAFGILPTSVRSMT